MAPTGNISPGHQLPNTLNPVMLWAYSQGTVGIAPELKDFAMACIKAGLLPSKHAPQSAKLSLLPHTISTLVSFEVLLGSSVAVPTLSQGCRRSSHYLSGVQPYPSWSPSPNSCLTLRSRWTEGKEQHDNSPRHTSPATSPAPGSCVQSGHWRSLENFATLIGQDVDQNENSFHWRELSG